jgi:hypothetical protein
MQPHISIRDRTPLLPFLPHILEHRLPLIGVQPPKKLFVLIPYERNCPVLSPPRQIRTITQYRLDALLSVPFVDIKHAVPTRGLRHRT